MLFADELEGKARDAVQNEEECAGATATRAMVRRAHHDTLFKMHKENRRNQHLQAKIVELYRVTKSLRPGKLYPPWERGDCAAGAGLLL